MSVKRNVIANYLGQGWVAVMGLAFVPLYIRLLGMEAYGLIGLFAVMQAWLTLLDMGMTPTLGREMARFTAGDHSPQSIRNLLRSLEIVAFVVGVAICLGILVTSGWLANDWLRAEKLPTHTVANAISVMSLVVALRFVESIYRSALFGLQRQVWYNAVNSVLATVRGAGALLVLTNVSATISAFFMWQAVVSLLSIAVFAAGVYRALPHAPERARFSSTALLGVWRFAGAMMGITFLALLLTQVDKVLLSRLISLEAFGYYTFAATVAGALYLAITPITTAMFPRWVELVSQARTAALAASYHRGSQLVVALTAPAALLLTFFGEGVLFAWSGDAVLARHAGPLLSVLAFGTFLNGLMYMPCQLQLAHGWTSLGLMVNIAAVMVLVPAIFWVVPSHGALGAAWVWIALNVGYLIVAIHLMHRRILPAEKWRWYIGDVALPASGALASLFLMDRFRPVDLSNRLAWLAFLMLGLLGAVAASVAMIKVLRVRLFVSIHSAKSP